MQRTMVGMALVLLLMGLAGCGDDNKDSSSSAGGSSKSSVDLRTVDFAFKPATITAKAGQKVTVKVENKDDVEHNFSISSLKVDKDVEGGEDATVSFTPDKSGSLEFFCKYHARRGMKGSVTVS